MNKLFQQLVALLRRYTMGQRIVIILVFIGIVSSIISMILWANRPEYEVLFNDLSTENASKIITELKDKKVDYQITNNGMTLLVPKKNVPELRLEFAEKGYVGEKIFGYEIFDEEKIGMTSFMQQLNLKRALEGELVKTINQLSGVKNSRVHIVLPEKKLFEEGKEGSASITLYLERGTYLKEEQVKGIRALVASSVERISPGNVVVVDSEGNILSSSPDEENALGAAGNQYELQHKIENKLRNKVTSIVERVVGANNAVIEVSADLNFEQIERTSEFTDPDNVTVLSEESHTESIRNSDSTDNVNEEHTKENIITNYEINKTVEHFVSNTGNIKRLTVAVSVNGKYEETENNAGRKVTQYKPRSENELNEIGRLVRAAVGYDETRGDIIEVSCVQFETVETDQEYFEEAEKKEQIQRYITNGIIAASILFAFFVIRSLIRNSEQVFRIAAGQELPELISDSDSIGELAGVESAKLIGAGGDEAELIPQVPKKPEREVSADIFIKKLSPEARAKLKAKEKMTEDIVKFAKEKPEQAAQLIRMMING